MEYNTAFLTSSSANEKLYEQTEFKKKRIIVYIYEH